MFHYNQPVQNTRGDALVGYFVQAISTTDGSIVPIYADSSATPIVNTSGVADMAKVNSDGMADFWIAGGEYDLDIYAADAGTKIGRLLKLPMIDTLADAATATAAAATATAASEAATSAASVVTNLPLNVLTYMTGAERNDVLNRAETLDVSAALADAIQDAIDLNRPLYIPGGTYKLGVDNVAYLRPIPTISDGCSIVIFGDGPGNTILKQAPHSSAADFKQMLYFLAANVTVENFELRDMTLDKNGASNGNISGDVTYQHSHILHLESSGTGLWRNVTIENVVHLDKVGGGTVLAGGVFEQAIIRNCHGRNWSGYFSQRGDYEFQATVGNFIVEGSTGSYTQCEPNDLTPAAAYPKPRASFIDCVIDQIDVKGFDNDVTAQTVILTNCKAETLLACQNVKLQASKCRFTFSTTASLRWIRLAPGSFVEGCTCINKYDSGTNTITPAYFSPQTTLGGFYLTFRDCKFEPGSGASGTTTGSCVGNTADTYDGSQPFRVRFIDCGFSPLYQRTIDAYRTGNFELIRCDIGGWVTGSDGALRVGGLSGNYGTLVVRDCNFSAVTGTNKIYCTNSNLLWQLRIGGTHDYGTARISWSSATSLETLVRFDGTFTATAAPTAEGVIGQTVRVSGAAGTQRDYLATTNSTTAATWLAQPQGYLTGSGGTVTQATSKSTGVTLSKPTGQITMNAAALAATTIVSFALTNTLIAAGDVLVLNHVSGGTPGSYTLNAQCAAGSATINVRNNTAGSLSEAIVIGFVLVKGATA